MGWTAFTQFFKRSLDTDRVRWPREFLILSLLFDSSLRTYDHCRIRCIQKTHEKYYIYEYWSSRRWPEIYWGETYFDKRNYLPNKMNPRTNSNTSPRDLLKLTECLWPEERRPHVHAPTAGSVMFPKHHLIKFQIKFTQKLTYENLSKFTRVYVSHLLFV